MALNVSNFCFSELLDGLLEHIFGYLSLNDVSNCARVCKNWSRFLSDENNEIWRCHCLRKLSEKVNQIDKRIATCWMINLLDEIAGSEVRSAALCSDLQVQAASILSRLESSRLIPPHLHQAQRFHASSQSCCAVNRRSTSKNRLRERKTRLGNYVGRTARNGRNRWHQQ